MNTILVIDDSPIALEQTITLLCDTYLVRAANSGRVGLEYAANGPVPDLILLDVEMPEMNGYEVCRRLKADPATRDIPVIFLTAHGEGEQQSRGFDLGAVDYVVKPIEPVVLRARVGAHIKSSQYTHLLSQYTHELEQQVAERTADLKESRHQIINRLMRAAEYRDNETGNHVIRMSHYARLIAKAMGMDERFVDLLYAAAPMHDIGKIGIPDSILLKPGKLDPEEWVIMRKHPVIGAKILGEHDDELLQMARIVALNHHEKWDGSGYPNQLKGKTIPLAARIVAIADAFDALTSKRPYKEADSIEVAASKIEEDFGKHFDPGLRKPFKDALPEMKRIKEEHPDQE